MTTITRLFSLACLWTALTATPALAAARQVIDVDGHTMSLARAPERVVALSEIDLDVLLALGVKPIGTINGRGQSSVPHYLTTEDKSLTTGIQIVGDLGRPNVEAIVRLKPDLILTSPQRPEVLAILRKIAPTYVSYKDGDDWKDVFKRVAQALDRDAQAQAFMADYQKRVDAAKAVTAGFKDKTASIVRWNPNGPAFMYQDSFASLVLHDMGLERPAVQRIAGQRHSMPLSLEALDQIDAQWLFVGTLDPKGDAADGLKTVGNNPAFQRLSAVKGGRFFTVDGSKWTSIGGPLAALSIVNETTTMISGTKPAK